MYHPIKPGRVKRSTKATQAVSGFVFRAYNCVKWLVNKRERKFIIICAYQCNARLPQVRARTG